MRDPDALLRLAVGMRQSWQDGLFASDKARWQDVTPEEKTLWLAERAPHHGATYREFLEAAKLASGVRRLEPNQEWGLCQQFQQGQRQFAPERAMSDDTKTLHQVWHKESGGHVHAFTVHSKDLLTALVLPTIDPKGGGVSTVTPASRSTTFGDVIVTPDHAAYEVAGTAHGVMFDLIDFPPARAAKLAAEFREDLRAGISDALKTDGVRFADVMHDAGLYGVKPEDVADIRKEVEQEGMER